MVYAPLQGVVLQGNEALCRVFKGSDPPAPETLAALGLTENQFEAFCLTPQEAQAYLEPRWSETFEPTAVTLFLTQACTMSCSYCYCHGGKGGSMPWERAKAALDLAIGNALKVETQFQPESARGRCWRVLALNSRPVSGTSSGNAEPLPSFPTTSAWAPTDSTTRSRSAISANTPTAPRYPSTVSGGARPLPPDRRRRAHRRRGPPNR